MRGGIPGWTRFVPLSLRRGARGEANKEGGKGLWQMWSKD